MKVTRDSLRAFIADLRRRKVLRVVVGYAIMGWVVVEVAATTFPILGLPDWTPRLVLVLLTLGLPAAIVLAWAYDVTPEGVERTRAAHVGGEADRWRAEQQCFVDALELPEDEREEFVRREAPPSVRSGVLRLLRAHARASPLDDPVRGRIGPLAPTAVAPLSEGSMVGQYEVLEKLGGGGMGVVYRARDGQLGRTVALKLLPPHLTHDEDAKQRFMVEAKAAAALDHMNICTLLEIGETEAGRLFLAMSYYEGETLKRRLEQGPLRLPEALDMVAQVALGLAAAHAKGIIHRDVKPANLIITTDGVVKIVDFGVAKLADVAMTEPDVTPGTVAYMSPEQARGEGVDSRTDVWSLGVVMYEAITGQRPFAAGSNDMARQAILHDDPVPIRSVRPDVPPQVASVVERALEHDRNRRYRTGAELRDAVAELMSRPGIVDAEGSGPGTDPGEELKPEGERRQATLVVCALWGFSHLLETLAPADLDRLLARVRHWADEVARRFGGVLNRANDDRFELLFGVPDSHEDHCFRAVRAALELHERVRALELPGGDRRLALSTGVDTGHVVVRPGKEGSGVYRVAGEARAAAARLQARSGDDELWMTPRCHRVVGPFFDTVMGEPMSLTPGSVVTPHRALRLSGLRTRLEAAGAEGLTAYVGRRREVARLREALTEARGGCGGVVAIVGEAGVGKSRLLHEFRASTEDEPLTFLEGRCQSGGIPVPYLPFVEVLRSVLDLDSVDDELRVHAIREGLERLGPELVARLPLFLELLSLSHPEHPVPSHLRGEVLQHAMREALAGLVTVLSERTPVVLVLEDWHWADEASQSVLEQIAEVAGDHALLTLVTARPPAPELAEGRTCSVLQVEPLDERSTQEMLRALLDAPALPESFAEHVHGRTGGNPFFVEEVARTLLEEGMLSVRDGFVTLAAGPDTLELPETVEAVIRGRLDRLDRDTRDVVRVASVIGREFERRFLEHAVGGSRLPHAIQALKTAGLINQVRVIPDAEYRFNHVLTREVAYASLLRNQRAEVHRRVGEAIEELHEGHLGEHHDRLADHFAEAGVWPKAVRYGLKAAGRKIAVSAFGEAMQQLERCEGWIDELDDSELAADLLVRTLLSQERVSEFMGKRERQQVIIDRLLALLDGSPDHATLAQIHQRQGDLHTLGQRYDDAERALVEALRLSRLSGDPFILRTTLRSLGLLRWHQDRLQEALAPVEEAIAIDKEHDDRSALVGELSNLAAILKGLGRLPEARGMLEEAAELAAELQSGPSGSTTFLNESYILHNLANVSRALGDTASAVEHLERARNLTDREQMPVQLSYHYTSLAHLALQEGEIDRALDLYRQAVETSRSARFTLGLAQALRMLGGALLGLEREALALPPLREAAELFAQLSDVVAEADVWRDVARAEERVGSHDPARTAWLRAAEACRDLGEERAEVEALEGVARCARRTGRSTDDVVTAHTRALARAEEIGARDCQGRLLNTLGIIAWERGDYPGARRWYERALEALRELDDTRGVGLILNSIAVTLRSEGRLDEARRQLEEALPRHRESGNATLEGHALAALGDVELEAGRAERAVAVYESSLELRSRTGDRLGEGWMHRRLAAAHGALERRDLAERHVGEARRIAIEVQSDELAAACGRTESASPH